MPRGSAMINGMYDRFTMRARAVMQLANQEAIRFGHEYIAPEHIAAGLLKAGNCAAAAILSSLGVNVQDVVVGYETIISSLPRTAPVGGPRSKKS